MRNTNYALLLAIACFAQSDVASGLEVTRPVGTAQSDVASGLEVTRPVGTACYLWCKENSGTQINRRLHGKKNGRRGKGGKKKNKKSGDSSDSDSGSDSESNSDSDSDSNSDSDSDSGYAEEENEKPDGCECRNRDNIL